MEELLSLAKKRAEEAEVFFVTHEETPVIFEANRLKQVQTRQSMMVALRIIRDGRIGFSTSTDLNDRKSLVDQAVEVSQFGASVKFEFPNTSVYPQCDIYDPLVETISIEGMIDMGESLIARVREHTAQLLCEAGVSRSKSQIRLINSRGGEANYSRSIFGISLEGTLIRGTDMLFVGDGESSCRPIEEPDKIADSVINQLEQAKEQASIAGGKLPVIFTPMGVVSAIIAPLAMAFNGRTVLQGASPLGEKRGQKVFDEKLSLRDDATIAYRPASRSCDDEGVTSRITPLIQNGNVGEFFYDLQTAGLAGVNSTGNGERSGVALPAPSLSNLVFNTGDISYKDMVTDVKEGLLVDQLMGASQTNVLGGEFSGNVLLGYKIENGEVVGRVKDTVVSGNIYEALKALAGIGSEGRWIGGMVFTPALYCAGLKVVSKS